MKVTRHCPQCPLLYGVCFYSQEPIRSPLLFDGLTQWGEYPALSLNLLNNIAYFPLATVSIFLTQYCGRCPRLQSVQLPFVSAGSLLDINSICVSIDGNGRYSLLGMTKTQ